VLARFFLPPVPEIPAAAGPHASAGSQRLAGLDPNAIFVGIALAGFLCCVPMAMPQGHLVALCSDRGLTPSVGAAMLSVLLAVAFLSRQAWGLVADPTPDQIAAPYTDGVGTVTLDVVRRDFERGIILNNPGSIPQVVDLHGTFQKLRGHQDPSINNGQLITSVTLPGRDGLVLLRVPDGGSPEQ